MITAQEAMALAFFSVLLGFCLGAWAASSWARFLLRRNCHLEEENASLREEKDPADWWKGSP